MGSEVTVKPDDTRSELPRLMRRLKPAQRKVLRHMVQQNASIWQAATACGVSKATAFRWLRRPEFMAARDAMLDDAAAALGITQVYVLQRTQEVVERCMQAEPVRDHEGNETGEYEFDASGALKGLDMLGKHRRLWGDERQFDRLPTVILNVGVRGGDVQITAASAGGADRMPMLPKVTRGA